MANQKFVFVAVVVVEQLQIVVAVEAFVFEEPLHVVVVVVAAVVVAVVVVAVVVANKVVAVVVVVQQW